MSDEKPLLEFPCEFSFKAVGPNDGGLFFRRVQKAVSVVVPVSQDAMRSRVSGGGKYVSVTASVVLHSQDQVHAIYAELKKIDDLKFLL